MKLGIIAPYAPVDLSRATKRGLEYVEFCFNNNDEAKAFIANYDKGIAEALKLGVIAGATSSQIKSFKNDK